MGKYKIIRVGTKETKKYIAEKEEYMEVKTSMEFTQVYEAAYDLIKDLRRASSFNLLFWCLKNMNSENVVYLNGYNKTKLTQERNIHLSTLDKSIKELKDYDVLEFITRGVYRVNIFCFWRSNPEIRDNRIREVIKEVQSGERKQKTLGINIDTTINRRYE